MGRGREWVSTFQNVLWVKKIKRKRDGEEDVRVREMEEENEKIKNNKIILKNDI
jgi:hypothetical protein